ncbi:MAG: helix-turn-helix transcriptional regulator, partial [Anaerotignum sp.]|nr:helix-turn-helix transcriptional regulator [Anaerotignum sp.]
MGNDHLKGESIGQRIWHLRNKFGISQEDLAKVVGTSIDMIKKYEKDIITDIPYADIEKIATALHTPPA